MRYLFSTRDMFSTLQEATGRAKAAAEKLPINRLVSGSVDDLADAILDQHALTPLTLYLDKQRGENKDVTLPPIGLGMQPRAIQRHALIFYIPYTGDKTLFECRPSTYGPATPMGKVVDSELTFMVVPEGNQPEQIRHEIAAFHKVVSQYVEWVNKDVVGGNTGMRREVLAVLSGRRYREETGKGLLAALDIPVRHVGADRSYEIPVRRTTIDLSVPAATPQAEPRMSEELYEQVLRTISGFTNALERLPTSASRLAEEETLRDFLLILLNGNYEGIAAGEVFNNIGKSDVLLRWADRNAFIGECKIWKGQEEFAKAIDQLFRYTAWRDTKAALIVFIKNRNATDAIAKADERMRAHPNFLFATQAVEPDRRRDYVFQTPGDNQRTMNIALLPVVIPEP